MRAIAEFGSRRRGDSDEYSDNDILIINDDPKARSVITMELSRLGYSCSSMSSKQLHFMQCKGSLFLQHLKLEAQILWDDNSQLRIFLDQCNAIPPEQHELDRCIQSLGFALSKIEDDRARGWQFDFTFCLSRDLLIKKAAQSGRLSFRLRDIVEFLLVGKDEKINALRALQDLRTEKSRYRRGLPASTEATHALNTWKEIARRSFQMNLSEETFDELLINRKFSSNYEILRTIEYLSLTPTCSSKTVVDERIKRMIKAPNRYGACQARQASLLTEMLNELLRERMHRADQGVSGP